MAAIRRRGTGRGTAKARRSAAGPAVRVVAVATVFDVPDDPAEVVLLPLSNLPVINQTIGAPESDSDFDTAGGLQDQDQDDLPEEPDWPGEDAMAWRPPPWWWRITPLRNRSEARILNEEEAGAARIPLALRIELRMRPIRCRLATLSGGPRRRRRALASLDGGLWTGEADVIYYERFTDQAKQAVVLAREEAMRLGHSYIGTEHMLLGLICEGECIGAKALKSLGVSLDAVRQQVEEIIGQGQQAPSGDIPWTPQAWRVLELSLREAQRVRRNYVGTGDILLGLIAEGEGVAAQVLVRLGADLGRARQSVRDLG
jgi:hypothetical protein